MPLLASTLRPYLIDAVWPRSSPDWVTAAEQRARTWLQTAPFLFLPWTWGTSG
jgi:hypothetical protein